ncbi:GATOR complex protein MIOS [Anthonomus grandis grandis]|uniref:GATOR complex protein MIOS n=1 Tax=Anthonomus grandis grandis TaxID=2921223 RepID=UPI0021661624|nr:GATOR complex protein MIOS [Anthonomus grandis grandis]
MTTRLEALWSPIPQRFIIWGGDTITSYQLAPKKEAGPAIGVYNVSKTHVGELICSASNQHQVKCMDIYPHSQGDEIVALGGSGGKVTVTYMAKLAWEGSGLPKKEFTAKCPRPCTSIHFNPVDSHLVAVGFEKYKPDNSIMIFDITQVCAKRDPIVGTGGASESSKPVWEIGMSEHCQNLSWFHNNSKILATGMNMKFIRLFDIRDLNVVSSTVTKAALGVCTNPKDDKYLASYFENQVYVWDTRNIEKPIQILPQPKPVLKVAWCPTKCNLLTTLQKDSGTISIYDIQQPSIGNEEVEPTVMERVVNLKSLYPLTSFSWHRSDENRILTSSGSNSSGKIEVKDYRVYDRITLNLTPYFELFWSHGKKILKCADLRKVQDGEDIAVKIQRRAKAQYGLEDELYRNAEMVKEDEVLSNVWHWLHLSAKLVEEGRVATPSLSTAHKHPGVLSVLTGGETTESSPSEVKTVSWTDLGHPNCKGNVKFYMRPDRSMALLLCSWPLNNHLQSVAAFAEHLEREGAYSRAAALAVFNLQVPLAIEILNRAPFEAGLGYVGIALAGFSNEDESNWKRFCASAVKKIADPYLKAMFSFLMSGNNNYECVLRETDIAVDDRVGFALVFLSDHKLLDYLNRLSGELCEQGNLDGLLLTGNSPQGLKLLQNYLDDTADIQSTTLVAVRAFPHELDSPTVKNWIENYQEVLNRWKFWFERAEFDLMLVKNKNERPPPQIYMSCTYCGKNISAHLRTLKNQQFSRLNVAGATNKLTGCPHCRKPLPRCIICLMTMGTVVGDVEGIKPQSFDNWFTWCQSCRHGGHSRHMTNWFKEHLECPMVGCSCKCYSLDYTSPAN